MATLDWSRFAIRIFVNASRQEVYQLWATRKGMEHWFLRMSEYKSSAGVVRGPDESAQKNDTYQWRWFGYPDDVTEQGTILDCNGKDLFKFSFGKAGNCTVNLREEKGSTLVELLQDEIPTDDAGRQHYHLGCKTGWTFYFANLKSLIEGGIDLRNKDESKQDVINS
jgi:uncharacterized protein YndB with AHSA1/START domain